MPRALVVEDYAPNLRLVRALLEDAGWSVVAAPSADAALQAAHGMADEHPDVVLLDIQLPGRSGLDLLPDLRRLLPGVPVVALTAYAMEGDERRFRAAGFDAYIAKPVDVARFGDQVAAAAGARPEAPP